MKRNTGAIVATILTSLLCGLPGLLLACLGIFVAFGAQLPDYAQVGGNQQDAMLTLVLFLGIGMILIAIPVIVGIITLRKKRPSVPQSPTYVAPSQPAHTPPAPAVQTPPVQTTQSIPQPPPQPANPPPKPAPSPAPARGSAEDVLARLMALNRPTAPYHIVDGRSENVDLIAEWKIVDAQWYEIFGKANLTKVFRIYLKLDPARREVRAMDREYTLQWRAGVPSLSVEASFFKGQKSSISFGTGYAFTETLAPGQVYKYKFNTNELKKPIQETVAACGWTYKGVAFGKL